MLQTFPTACQSWSYVLAAAFLIGVLILANAISIGEARKENSPGDCFSRRKGRRAGRQEQEPGADVFEDRGGLGAAVGSKVVQYHHVALLQGRGQLGFDAEVEEFPVYRPSDAPGRVEPVMT